MYKFRNFLKRKIRSILLAGSQFFENLRRKDDMNSALRLTNGKLVNISKRVIASTQVGNIVVVLTEEASQISNENIYGYDFDGNQLWQIESLTLFHEHHDYTSIYFQDSELFLYNRCGVEVKINPQTDKILSKDLVK